MYRVDAGPVNITEQQLESLRHQIGSRWSDGNQDYCQRCRKNSDWKDDLPFSERRPAREDALGFAVLPRLLAEAPLAVYGLKGNPVGLRLSDLDWNTRGPGWAILRYTSGEPDYPQRALDLTQDADLSREPGEKRMMAELRAIISLVLGCASTEQRKSYERRRNVHRYWNLDYVSRAPRRNVTIQIDGKHTEVELARLAGAPADSHSPSHPGRSPGYGGVRGCLAGTATRSAQEPGRAEAGRGRPGRARPGLQD